MGKWTLEHHDEVLRNKIKNMVQGAVKRMNTEKESPSISYEAFVEELDEGDSFTTGLIDVLVKEMAERRTRPNPIDRRLISERTAKALPTEVAGVSLCFRHAPIAPSATCCPSPREKMNMVR
ncbi:hypothetical protein NUW54_g5409 [Trametes sanguinea]|uniref:Uncharacterized protein n=1 Tax=Trametes sanguinea TaxID=158606 RepID=A0ACC1PVP9_9APHY|nr:hypothetical protein NUW54_g5409 [Trametes sanguinea]